MSQVEWYYARDNRQVGPVSSAELKRLATFDELRPDDLVWREGMTEWAAARNVRGLFGEEGGEAAAAAVGESAVKVRDFGSNAGESGAKPQGTSAAQPARHPFDVLLDKYRPHFNARFLDATAAVFQACGSYGLLAAAALAAAFALIAATKTSAIDHLLWGAIWVFVLLALQYAAGKFCGALGRLNRTAGGCLSSSVVPDSLAMLSKVVGVAVLLGSIATAIETTHYEMILFGVAAFFVCAYLTVVAINPAALNISIAPEAIAGDEAIGVLMFLLKALLRLAPVAFGAGVVCGTLLMGVACLDAFAGESSAAGAGGVLLVESLATASAARYVLIVSAALPLGAYLVFLLGNLLLNLWHSLLSLPVKLDRLAQNEQEEIKRGERDTVTTEE